MDTNLATLNAAELTADEKTKARTAVGNVRSRDLLEALEQLFLPLFADAYAAVLVIEVRMSGLRKICDVELEVLQR